MSERTVFSGVVDNIRAMAETDFGGDFTYAQAERLNADGWTVELPAALGGAVRHEGVTLSPARLQDAWDKATK